MIMESKEIKGEVLKLKRDYQFDTQTEVNHHAKYKNKTYHYHAWTTFITCIEIHEHLFKTWYSKYNQIEPKKYQKNIQQTLTCHINVYKFLYLKSNLNMPKN